MFPFTTTTYTSPFDPNSSYSMSPGFSSFGSSFGSEAANLEYSILSAILGSTNSSSESDRGTSTPPPSSIPTTSMTGEPPSPNFTTPGWSDYSREQTGTHLPPNHFHCPSDEKFLTNRHVDYLSPDSRVSALHPTRSHAQTGLTPPSNLLPFSPVHSARSPANNQLLRYVTPCTRTTPSTFQNGSSIINNPVTKSVQPGTATASPVPSSASLPHTSSSSEDDPSIANGSSGVASHLQCRNKVYENVTKSFDYTEGYHFLMKFLVSR